MVHIGCQVVAVPFQEMVMPTGGPQKIVFTSYRYMKTRQVFNSHVTVIFLTHKGCWVALEINVNDEWNIPGIPSPSINLIFHCVGGSGVP